MSNLAEVMPAMPTQAPATPALSNNGIFQFGNFIEAMNAADLLARSAIVPDLYRYVDSNGNHNQNANANCLLALNMAQRMGYDPLMIMQNLYVIKGRPAWSSQFVTAAINGCGRFTALNYEEKDLGKKEVKYYNDIVKIDDMSCVAWAIDKSTGERVESIAITIEMAVEEGWYTKKDSKWKTMAKQMLRYRAAAFFGRSYVPDILMGIYPKDEIEDFLDVTPAPAQQSKQQQIPCYDIKPLLQEIEAITTLEQVRPLGEHIKELSENPNVNLCGDDLPTLRNALTVKRNAIKAQLESVKADSVVEAEPVANDEPNIGSQLADEITKAISVMTLDDFAEVDFFIEQSKPELSAANYNVLKAAFNQKYSELESEINA